jgi:hypothetical protein
MAEKTSSFNIDPSISLNVKGPQPITLGDMVNIARGVQDYKQKQQTNPLEIQAKQLEVNEAQLKNLNNHYDNIIKNTSDLMADPDLTTDKIVQRAKEINANSGGNEKTLQQYLIGLPYGGSQKDLKAWLALGQAKTLSAQSRVEKLYPAGVLPGQLPNVSAENQPGGPQTQPQTGVSQDQMNQPIHSQPEKLPYPVRNPNTPYLPFPTEKSDQDEGFKFRNNLVNRQSSLSTSRRNLQEVMDSATKIEKEFITNPASLLGRGERLLRYGWNAEDLQTLRKDLANVVLANEQALGQSTDAGRDLAKSASGDETYSPKVLLGIANRAFSDVTNIQMKANAAQKFAEKYGDNNMKAFQQMWSKNEDSKIFEIYNIYNNEKLTKEEKEKAAKRLYPKDPRQQKIFDEKWNNIQKLEQTGSL